MGPGPCPRPSSSTDVAIFIPSPWARASGTASRPLPSSTRCSTRTRRVADPLTFVGAFSAGLVSFLSPCVLPLFPSYVSFVTGMSVDQLSSELRAAERARVLLHSLAFIAGFTAVFVSLGASFSAAGQLLMDYRDAIRIAGGALIVIFGLYIAGVLRIGLFGRNQQLHIQNK